jgi:hypothetical protein
MTILSFVAMAALMYFSYAYRKKATADAEVNYAHMTAGALASRLGLTVVEGDPNLNLITAAGRHIEKGATKTGGMLDRNSVKETRLVLAGKPDGRDTAFVYSQKDEMTDSLLRDYDRKRESELEYCFHTQIRARFPDFEVILRNPPAGMSRVKGVLAQPEQSFGDSTLDQAFLLRSADPSVGPYIREALRPLLATHHLHLLAHSGRIAYLADFKTYMLASYMLEEVARVQKQIAQLLEGAVAGQAVHAH